MKIMKGKLREIIKEEVESFRSAPPKKHRDLVLQEMKEKVLKTVSSLNGCKGLSFSEAEEIVRRLDEIRAITEAKNGQK